jgi:GDPmannose 4,6-dehydratase
MLQQEEPQDLVIATGQQHSVREFVEKAGAHLGMRIEWRQRGEDEVGFDARSGRTVVRIDPRYFRPAEVETLLGDASRAYRVLNWSPNVSFESLVHEMVTADHALARRDALVAREGYAAVAVAE